MKNIYIIVSLLILFGSLCSCEKKDKETQAVLGSIYGVITDKATGEPIKNASVELRSTGLKAFPSRAVSNNNYWSSTPGSSDGYYYYVNFNTGESGEMPRVNSFKVRAVRSN